MICLRKRERALISVSLVFLVVSCRSQSESVGTQTSASETVVSSTPPFQTREPDRYRAIRTITMVMSDGKTVITKTSAARDGDMRRSESEVASKTLVYLEIPAGRFVLLPDEKVYADSSEDANVEDDESLETSPERLLHVDGGSVSYQKLGTGTIEGRSANKYRIVVNSSGAASVSVSETLIWIDEALQMPLRSETKSADGTRVTMELSDIQIEVDRRLFQVPDDYKKVAFSELRKTLASRK
jgi:outer membrane lipoprotein-sorting protein